MVAIERSQRSAGRLDCDIREKGDTALADSSRDFPWWRGFAVLWGVLAIVAATVRAWSALGMALAFLTGFLALELRTWQRIEPRVVGPKLVVLSVVAAALGTAGIYLILRFQFQISSAWWGVLLVFLGLIVLSVAGPFLARLFPARVLTSEDD